MKAAHGAVDLTQRVVKIGDWRGVVWALGYFIGASIMTLPKLNVDWSADARSSSLFLELTNAKPSRGRNPSLLCHGNFSKHCTLLV